MNRASSRSKMNLITVFILQLSESDCSSAVYGSLQLAARYIILLLPFLCYLLPSCYIKAEFQHYWYMPL